MAENVTNFTTVKIEDAVVMTAHFDTVVDENGDAKEVTVASGANPTAAEYEALLDALDDLGIIVKTQP